MGSGVNPGIASQAGFAFQEQIFCILAAEMGEGDSVCYEGPDDVSLTDSRGFLKLFQVKQTNVGKDDVYQIYTNWMMTLLGEASPTVEECMLVQDDCYKCSSFFDDISKEEFLGEVKKRSIENKGCLAAQLYSSVGGNDGRILEAFDLVKANAKYCRIGWADYENRIWAGLTKYFATGDEESSVFKERVKEFQRIVSYKIHESMRCKEPCTLSFQRLLGLCEDVRSSIGLGKFMPSYSAWLEQAKPAGINTLGRESRQLGYCFNDSDKITNHLFYGLYYHSLRMWHMENCRVETVADIEGVTYSNFCDAVERLSEDGRDTPAARLRETKREPNSFTQNDYERWGSCIYLTGDNIPLEKRISWKDEDDKDDNL